MKKALFLFEVAILLGMAITVSVAWMCASWSPVTQAVFPVETVHGEYPDFIPGPECVDEQEAWWHIGYGRGWMEAMPMGAAGAEGFFKYFQGNFSPAYRQAGWPWRALGSVVRVAYARNGDYLARWDLPNGEILRRGPQTDELPELFHAKPGRRIPLLPLWPGFVLDTLVYAGAVAAFYPFLLSAPVRRKRKTAQPSA